MYFTWVTNSQRNIKRLAFNVMQRMFNYTLNDNVMFCLFTGNYDVGLIFFDKEMMMVFLFMLLTSS